MIDHDMTGRQERRGWMRGDSDRCGINFDVKRLRPGLGQWLLPMRRQFQRGRRGKRDGGAHGLRPRWCGNCGRSGGRRSPGGRSGRSPGRGRGRPGAPGLGVGGPVAIEAIAFAPATDGLLLVAFLLAAPAGEATCPTSDDRHGSHRTTCLARHATHPAAKVLPRGCPGEESRATPLCVLVRRRVEVCPKTSRHSPIAFTLEMRDERRGGSDREEVELSKLMPGTLGLDYLKIMWGKRAHLVLLFGPFPERPSGIWSGEMEMH